MAILAVEGWRGPGTVGAAGEIGPYQITRAYWQDARMPTGTHQDCEDPAYAKQVMVRYWQRYCPQALAAGDVEVLAGVHHWGPKGTKRVVRARDDYVSRVLAGVGKRKGGKS
jgi:ectoine hydroxylase-related dioxygenase (phytanoyl-CoA dioxygenase family)